MSNKNGKTSRRVRMLIRRALRHQERGKRLFEKSRESLKLAMQNGLAVGQQVEIEIPVEDGSSKKEVFAIKDNFAGDVAFKRSYVSHYELEIVPKYKREQKPEANPQPKEFANTSASFCAGGES